MQRTDFFVRRHEHEHAQALADQTVDDVEEARQPLSWEPNGKALSVLANLVHDDKEISRWGINE